MTTSGIQIKLLFGVYSVYVDARRQRDQVTLSVTLLFSTLISEVLWPKQNMVHRQDTQRIKQATTHELWG